ncbi:MAG: HD domain-containing protein [Candidatus Omnitrophica bacterium]|nr:HD domain-containing protein [Candidatus Omnitrophota bacterium]
MGRAGKRSDKINVNDKNTVLWALFFEKLLQNVTASVMVTDDAGKVIFVNENYLNFFRFDEKDIVGKSWIDVIIPQDQRPKVEKIFNDIKKRKMLGKFNTPVNGKKKTDDYLCWIAIPLEKKRTMLYTFIGKKGDGADKRMVKVFDNTKVMLNTAYAEVVETIFSAAEKSEPGTAKHAVRVMFFAVTLAKKLKIKKDGIERLKVASLLHDLGKLALDDRILLKKGKLDEEEFREIKKHPIVGSEIVSLVYFLKDIIPIMANHHENYDGSGYPEGIKGADIPLEARVLGIADIYEALTADRPYRRGFSRDDAVDIMNGEKGKKLDPKITDIFLEMVRNGEIEEVV